MKIQKKYKKSPYTHSEYVEYARKLWEVAELQQKLMPFQLGFSVEIVNGMVNFEREQMPHTGFMIGTDMPDLTGFLDSIAMELRTLVSETQKRDPFYS